MNFDYDDLCRLYDYLNNLKIYLVEDIREKKKFIESLTNEKDKIFYGEKMIEVDMLICELRDLNEDLKKVTKKIIMIEELE